MAVSRTMPSPDSNRLWQSSLLVAAVVLLVHLALTVVFRHDQAVLATAGNLLSFVETAAATFALGLMARQTTRDKERSHLGWGFLTLALLVTAIGDAVWWIIQNAQGEVPLPSLAEPFYLAFYPLFAAGLVLFPAMPHLPGQRLQLALDVSGAMLAGILLFWAFGIGPLLQRESAGGLEIAAAVAYPAGDLALLAALLLLLNRRVSPASEPALKLLAAGSAIMLVTDSLFSYQVVGDTYISGGFLDLGFTLTYILFALAAIRALSLRSAAKPVSAASRQDDMGVQVASWSAALPYVAVLLAFTLLVWDHFHPTGVEFPVLVAVLGSIVVLMAARQILGIRENRALQQAQRDLNERLLRARDELEARVEARTWELTRANAALEAEVQQHQIAETQLRTSLQEKEVLLKEVHHRVRNNLQVVYSLFSLQSHTASDRAVAEALREGQTRIKTMSLIHEKLYGSPDLAHIDFGDFLRNLVKHLYTTYQVNPATITLDLDVIDAWVSIDTAVPCGLIVNELLSNSLKHAFPGGRKGSVAVRLARADGNRLRLAVTDNGVGLPPGLSFQEARSLGMQLARILAGQIDGHIEVESTRGTRVEITFLPDPDLPGLASPGQP